MVSGSFGCSFMLSREVRRPRQTCSIIKRLERRVLSGLLEILWLASGAVDSITTSTRPAIALSLDLLEPRMLLKLTTPFAEHYTCIIPVKLPDYSRSMLYAFVDRLFRKLWRHIRRISSQRAPARKISFRSKGRLH